MINFKLKKSNDKLYFLISMHSDSLFSQFINSVNAANKKSENTEAAPFANSRLRNSLDEIKNLLGEGSLFPQQRAAICAYLHHMHSTLKETQRTVHIIILAKNLIPLQVKSKIGILLEDTAKHYKLLSKYSICDFRLNVESISSIARTFQSDKRIYKDTLSELRKNVSESEESLPAKLLINRIISNTAGIVAMIEETILTVESSAALSSAA